MIRKTSILLCASFSLAAASVLFNPQGGVKVRPDAILYEGIARNLAAGNGYSFDRAPPFRPEITRTPFLPALAACVFRIVGPRRDAVLWLNAAMIALAVALSYALGRELFGDERAAHIGAWLACLAPPVTGSANTFLTESPAILQVVLSAYLAARWRDWRHGPRAPAAALAIGLVMASLVLNRPNFAPPVVVAAAWIGLGALRGRWRSPRAWVSAAVFCAALGGPVLGWSARNASMGMAFAPSAAGTGAGYVYEVHRYRKAILEPGEDIPEANDRFYSHWKRPLGPEELLAYDRENTEWFRGLLRERWDRALLSIPRRVAAMFGYQWMSVYNQPWPNSWDPVMNPALAWLQRVLWLLSAAGAALAWRLPHARWTWLVSVLGVVLFSAFTICNPRYMIPLEPLAFPYGGVAISAVVSRVRRGRR